MSNNIFKRKKQAPIEHVEVGGFIVNWYFKEGSIVDSYMEIRTISDNWRMRLDARHEMYGYLLSAVKQDKKEQVHGYCVTLYILATSLDQGLINDVQKALAKFMKRKEKQAESEAKVVSEAQIAGDEALMQESIERGELRGDKKAERKAAKESQEEIRKVLKEDALAQSMKANDKKLESKETESDEPKN